MRENSCLQAEYDLEITALASDGRGLGRFDNKVFFVAGALPGDLVRCRILEDKGSFAQAVKLQCLKEAPGRITPLCPLQNECGGCALMPMPYKAQLEWKARLARDALERIGGIEQGALAELWTDPIPAQSLSHFRNKMEFAFGEDNGRMVLGQRRRASHAVVATPSCALLPPGAEKYLELVRNFAAKSGLGAFHALPGRSGSGKSDKQPPGAFWRFLTLRYGLSGPEATLGFHALLLTSPGTPRERRMVRQLGESLLAQGLVSFVHEERRSRDNLAFGQRRVWTSASVPDQAAGRFYQELGRRSFALDMADFFQVNSAMAENLLSLALEFAPAGQAMLDLYCGVGAPGQFLVANFRHCLGVEASARAVASAGENARASGLAHCEYRAGKCGQILSGLEPGSFDFVLADPPRSGLEPEALKGLLALAPKYLLYISCNPATLARDARALSSAYRLKRLGSVDLFPHTPHLECLSLWEKKQP